MWKKFLALTAIAGLFVTTNFTTTALSFDFDTPSAEIPSYLHELVVEPTSFNPAEGEVALVNFLLSDNANIYAFAVDSEGLVSRIHGSSVYPIPEEPGELTYTWTGKTIAGVALPDGLYDVKVFAFVEDALVDAETFEGVEVVSTPEDDDDDDNGEEETDPLRVTNLMVDPFRFSPKDGEKTELSFRLSHNAYVSVVVRQGGHVLRSFYTHDGTYWLRSDRTHVLSWNGKDNNGRIVADGFYTVEVTALAGDERAVSTRLVLVDTPEKSYLGCGGYWDTKHLNDDELCKAIEWVTSSGIFHGYADGSFGHAQKITRSEVLKVLLEAFKDVPILPGYGFESGFWDLDNTAWYMPYVRTAKFYGMLHGYPDGSARLGNNINRVEFLKLALEASESFTSFKIPTYHYSYYVDVNERKRPWYLNYAGVAHSYELFDHYTRYTGGPRYLNPGELVTRGEVAKLLYRMNLYGLL